LSLGFRSWQSLRRSAEKNPESTSNGRASGQACDAREHLATVAMMYRELGITYWLEKAEREIQKLASDI